MSYEKEMEKGVKEHTLSFARASSSEEGTSYEGYCPFSSCFAGSDSSLFLKDAAARAMYVF